MFFSESLPRWQSLNSEIKDSGTVKLTLKKLCPTRWSSRADSIISLKTNYLAVVKCLSNLSVVLKKKSDREEAKALQKKIENLEFIFLLTFQGKVFENVNLLSKILQSAEIDVGQATDLIASVLVKLQDMRDNYEDVFKMSVATAKHRDKLRK